MTSPPAPPPEPWPTLPEGLLGQLVVRALDVIIVTEATPLDEPGPRIVYVNEAFTRLTGYSPAEVLGRSPRFLQSASETDPETRRQVRLALQGSATFDGKILNLAKDGTRYWLDMHIFPLLDDAGEVTHFAAIERDVTAQVSRMNEWRHKALLDPLTGLLNRRGLDTVARTAWTSADPPGGAVLSLDIDRFKDVNDSVGHAGGDDVLAALGDTLQSSIRPQDHACRVGGDEFVVVLPGVTIASATGIAARIQDVIATASMERETPRYTVSIGIAGTPEAGTDLSAVIATSDLALYDAKTSGRNRIVTAGH